MKVKICGITDVLTAKKAIQYGADALGFVFAESKRKMSQKKAKEIIHQLPHELLKVGVFVNEGKEEIERIVEETGINVIQLHGDEPPDFCESFSLPVIKALSIKTEADIEKISEYRCEFVLLDSPKGKYRGGNGVTFDWTILASRKLTAPKIILAGGLTAENVLQGIELANPYMVDVSSGVETEGIKDIQKIKRFIETVKRGMKEEAK